MKEVHPPESPFFILNETMLYLFQNKYCDILGNCLICPELDEKLNTTFICCIIMELEPGGN